tara:strand:+ start:258 stop:431 length:174 start_codon:yes stop_codon:yes gene_type:complete
MEIGDKVKVIGQDIFGTILRKDKNKYIILDDDDSWQEENHLAELEYKDYELKKINYD